MAVLNEHCDGYFVSNFISFLHFVSFLRVFVGFHLFAFTAKNQVAASFNYFIGLEIYEIAEQLC